MLSFGAPSYFAYGRTINWIDSCHKKAHNRFALLVSYSKIRWLTGCSFSVTVPNVCATRRADSEARGAEDLDECLVVRDDPLERARFGRILKLVCAQISESKKCLINTHTRCPKSLRVKRKHEHNIQHELRAIEMAYSTVECGIVVLLVLLLH